MLPLLLIWTPFLYFTTVKLWILVPRLIPVPPMVDRTDWLPYVILHTSTGTSTGINNNYRWQFFTRVNVLYLCLSTGPAEPDPCTLLYPEVILYKDCCWYRCRLLWQFFWKVHSLTGTAVAGDNLLFARRRENFSGPFAPGPNGLVYFSLLLMLVLRELIAVPVLATVAFFLNFVPVPIGPANRPFNIPPVLGINFSCFEAGTDIGYHC